MDTSGVVFLDAEEVLPLNGNPLQERDSTPDADFCQEEVEALVRSTKRVLEWDGVDSGLENEIYSSEVRDLDIVDWNHYMTTAKILLVFCMFLGS